ncbi:MAG: DUF4932 domain-containing protein [Bacteroidales bacterium]
MKKIIILTMLTLILFTCANKNIKDEDNFFVFEPDIRLFTSYAFMNAAGYNHDWNPTMHPIRAEVRDYLDSILTDDYKKEIGEYYSKLGGGDFYGYGVYAINSNYPPDFGLIYDSCKNEEINKFVNFDSMLCDFYEKAHIGELWDRYYGKLHAINLQYKPFAELAIKQITAYCRVDSNYFRNSATGKFHYQQIPLMSHFTAFFNETGNDYWVISGPMSGEPDPSAFYHEPLHKIINPIVDGNPEMNEKVGALLSLAQEQLKGDYNSVSAMLCESFVRAIDRIIYARHNKITEVELTQIIENEYKLGHILTFYLLEHLPEYEASGRTLKEYYPRLMSMINIEFETKRWNNYWKNHPNE